MADETLDLEQYLIDNLVKSTYVTNTVGQSDHVSSLDLTQLEFIGNDVEYGPLNKKLYDPYYVDGVTYSNDTSIEQSEELDRTYQTTATVSWTVTKSLKFTEKLTIKVALPEIADVTSEFDFEASITSSEAQSSSVMQNWTIKTPIKVPPKSKVETKVIVSMANLTSSFSFNGELKGPISFVAWNLPDGTDGSVGQSVEGDITKFIPGMPLPDGLSFENGKLDFNGTGEFTGKAGVSIDVESKQIGSSGK